jgi:hypothetical protein
MAKQLWPYMRTEAKIYVQGSEVFIVREWADKHHRWIRRKNYYRNVTNSSLGRLRRLYAVRQYTYSPGRYEKHRTCYLRKAA